jgi:pimeloyl-ACP methyl ester carboxylesterase
VTVDQVVVRDVVVVVPGIMGSELVDASGTAVWSLERRSLVKALRTLGRSLEALELPAGIGDGPAPDGVRPGSLLGGLHVIPGVWSPIAGYGGLLRFLRSPRFFLVDADPGNPGVMPNLVTFPYDWRLSNRHNARRLKKVALDALEAWRSQPGMDEAKLVLICHSMGGLVARWFLEREGGAEYTRALVTIGTPHRGSLKALATLVNGLEPGVGPLRVGLTKLVRSMPSMYQLLPTYDCVVGPDGRRTAVAEAAGHGLSTEMLSDAVAFHESLADVGAPEYGFHKIVGIRQPTLTTASIAGGGLRASFDIDGRLQGGDGTVPRLAGEPTAGRGTEVHEVADHHGELQGARSTLDLIDGLVTREDVIWQDAGAEAFGVEMDSIWSPGEQPRLHVPDIEDRRLFVSVFDEGDDQVGAPVAVDADGRATLDPLPPGGYRARVASRLAGGPPPVTVPFLVWDPAAEIEPGAVG